MLAKDLMTRNVEFCTPDESAARALEIMERRNCGFVPVVIDALSKMLKGVITDRDLALYLGKSNKRASEARIGDCYSQNPHTVVEDTDLHDVAVLMEDYQVHRVPVVDGKGRILGVIALKDLAKTAWMKREAQSPEISEIEIGKVIEHISIDPRNLWG